MPTATDTKKYPTQATQSPESVAAINEFNSQQATRDPASVNAINDFNAGLSSSAVRPVDQNAPQSTTTSFRQASQANIEKFNELQARYQELQTAVDEANANKTTTTTTKEDSNGVATETTTTAPGDTETEDPYANLDEQEKKYRAEAETVIADITAQSDSIQKFADQAHRDLINATKQLYGARLKKMEDANMRLKATKKVVNFREGRSRFTPELAAGILTDEELSGQERLSEIEATMLSAIAQANSAKADGDLKRFNAAYDKIDAKIKEMNDQIQQNYENAVARDKELRLQAKEARDLQKAEFEQGLDRAEASAPSLLAKMESFTTEAERLAFIEAYADQTGIDADIIIGAVSQYSNDKQYKDLQISNIENQIYNRNRSTQATVDREARLGSQNNEESDSGFLKETENVIQGVSTLGELSNDKRQTVKAELRELGYYEENPPEWYITMVNEQAGQTVVPDQVKKEWETYRTNIINEV